MLNSLLLLLSIISLSTSAFLQSFEYMLGPLEISWPHAWVNNPLEFSSIYIEDIYTTLRFSFSVSIALPKSTYLEFSIPFLESPTKYSQYLPQSYPPSADITISLTQILLPRSIGLFGPISLTIRQLPEGQILASSKNLGYFLFYSRSSILSLPVHISYTESASKSILDLTELRFLIPLAVNLQPNDYLKIFIDKNFKVGSLKGVVWENKGDLNRVLNSTLAYFDDYQHCIVVYGGQGIVERGTELRVRIKGFVNPGWAGGEYEWKVWVCRFGTSTILQELKSSGPENKLVPGDIQILYWKPTNGYVSSDMIAIGAKHYMSSKFKLQHPLAVGNSIQISFEGIEINSIEGSTEGYVKFHPQEMWRDCIHQGLLLTCAATTVLPSDFSFELHILATFILNTAKVHVITMSNYRIIDKSYNNITLFIGSASNGLLDQPVVKFVDSYENASGEGILITGAYALSVYVDLMIQENCSMFDMHLFFPLTTSTGQASQFLFGARGYAIVKNVITSTYDFSDDFSEFQLSVIDQALIIHLDLTASSGSHLSMLIISGSQASPGIIQLPLSFSSIHSRMEILIKLISRNLIRYYSTPVFLYPSNAKLFATSICNNSPIPGIPVRLSLLPSFDWQEESFILYIDFTVSSFDLNDLDKILGNNLNSGLSRNSLYPSIGPISSYLNITWSDLDPNGTSHLILCLNSSSVIKRSVPITLTIPFPALTSTAVHKFSAELYAVRSSDLIIYSLSVAESSDSSTISAADVGDFSLETITSPSDIQNTGEYLPTITGSIALGGIDNVSRLIVVGFDQGWDISPTTSIGFGSMTKHKLSVLTSNDTAFKYSIGFISNLELDQSSTSFTIDSLRTSWFSAMPSGLTSLYISISSLGDFSEITPLSPSCEVNSKYIFTLLPRMLSVLSYLPLSSRSFGVDEQIRDFSISFALPDNIYAGSVISVLMDSRFITSNSRVSVNIGEFSMNGAFLSNHFITNDIKSDISKASVLYINTYNITLPFLDSAATISAFDTISILNSDRNTYFEYKDSLQGSDYSRTLFSSSYTTIGICTQSKYISYPMLVGSTSVTVQLEFFNEIPIPLGSRIMIKSEPFDSDLLVKDNTWCNYGFSSAEVVEDYLILTTITYIPEYSHVVIRKDKAFGIKEITPFVRLNITIVYGSLEICQMLPYNVVHSYISLPELKIFWLSIIPEHNNAGLENWYSFTFMAELEINSTIFIVFHAPSHYEAHPGRTFTYAQTPNVHFLYAMSSFGDIFCITDHWFIVCNLIASIKSYKIVDISLFLRNPDASEVFWDLYLQNSSYIDIAAPIYNSSVFIYDHPKINLDIINITHSEYEQLMSHEIILNIIENIYEGSCIAVRFPDSYDLAITNPNEVICSAHYKPLSNTINYLISPGSFCKSILNEVRFCLESGLKTNSTVLTLVAYGIFKPISGLQADQNSLSISDRAFTAKYSYLTHKFSVSYWEKGSSTLKALSYNTLNSAYTGFPPNTWESLIINKANPIVLVSGTFSIPIPVTVNDNKLIAKNLTISLISLYGLVHFDRSSLVLTNNRPFAEFRIGAAVTNVSLTDYIVFKIQETPIITGVTRYGLQPLSKVEIMIQGFIKYTVSFDKISKVSPILGSIPLIARISDGISPYSELLCRASIMDNAVAVGFENSMIRFKAGVNKQYFNITIRGYVLDKQTYTVQYSLSGVDSGSFVLGSVRNNFVIGVSYSQPANATILLKALSKTEMSMRITSDSYGVVTWAFFSSLTKAEQSLYDYNVLINKVESMIKEEKYSDYCMHQQLDLWSKEKANINVDDWDIFSLQMQTLAKSMFFYGQTVVKNISNQLIFNFDNLIAQNSYTAVAWIDNYSNTNVTFAKSSAITHNLDFLSKINLNLSTPITNNSSEKLALSLALALGTLPSRLLLTSADSNSFSFYLLPSLTSSSITSETVNSLVTSDLIHALNLTGISANAEIGINFSIVLPSAFGVPGYGNYTWKNINDYMVEFQFSAEADGVSCCAWVLNYERKLSSEEIFEGLVNGVNISSHVKCFEVKKGGRYNYTKNFFDYTGYGMFYFSCTACNRYPIIPLCLGESEVVEYSFERVAQFVISFGAGLQACFMMIIL